MNKVEMNVYVLCCYKLRKLITYKIGFTDKSHQINQETRTLLISSSCLSHDFLTK